MDDDTWFSSTPAAALLWTIETTYAAWLLMKKEYAADDVWLWIAKEKIKMAEDRLKRLLDAEDALTLINGDNLEYTTNASWNTDWPCLTGIEDDDYDFSRKDEF